jgi:hypothetical protein
MKITTLEEAEKRGAKIRRLVIYLAEIDGVVYDLPAEAHFEYKYSWRKFPKRRKRK